MGKAQTFVPVLATLLSLPDVYGQAASAALSAGPRPIPSDCNKPELLALGRPLMIPGEPRFPGLRLGLSLKSERYTAGQPVILYIWAYNPTDQPVPLTTCSDLGLFKERGFDVYDGSGRLVVRRDEAAMRARNDIKKSDPCQGSRSECTGNVMFTIAPHACVNGDNFDFSTNIAAQYDLPPGEYNIRPKPYGDTTETTCTATHPPFHKNPATDITFSIAPP